MSTKERRRAIFTPVSHVAVHGPQLLHCENTQDGGKVLFHHAMNTARCKYAKYPTKLTKHAAAVTPAASLHLSAHRALAAFFTCNSSS